MKVRRLHGRKFETRRQVMDEVIDWLKFYNYVRLHSTLGYASPMQ
jgi:transposase InsO family protein